MKQKGFVALIFMCCVSAALVFSILVFSESYTHVLQIRRKQALSDIFNKTVFACKRQGIKKIMSGSIRDNSTWVPPFSGVYIQNGTSTLLYSSRYQSPAVQINCSVDNIKSVQTDLKNYYYLAIKSEVSQGGAVEAYTHTIVLQEDNFGTGYIEVSSGVSSVLSF